MADDLRILQMKKVVYLRGLDGLKSWFIPVRYEVTTATWLQGRDGTGEWVNVPIEIELIDEGASYGG
jgi:hypothetical protein